MLRLIQYGNFQVRKTCLESFSELLSTYISGAKETELRKRNSKDR